MKKAIFVLLAALFFLPSVKAQSSLTIQNNHCSATTSCSYTNPIKPGDLLVIAGRTSSAFTENSGNHWTQVSFQGWYGAYDSLWYTTSSPTASNVVSIQFTSTVSDIFMLEYPPAVFDTTSSTVWLCCSSNATVGPVTTSGASDLLILFVNPSAPFNPVVPNFNPEVSAGEVVLLDQKTTTAGSFSSTVPQGSSWGAKLFAFTLTNPLPPPVTLTVSGSAIYDDNSAILPGPINISQQTSPNVFVQCGTISSDSSGNLSGSLTINPNLVDSNGNVVFMFNLPMNLPLMTYPVPVGEFQHGSTGLTINLTLFKQGPLAIKSQTLAVTP